MKFALKSAYLPCDSNDGTRYLVETLWPEGVDTYGLSPYDWLRELAPSYELKEMAFWKHWNSSKFREEYKQELQEPLRRACFDRLLEEAGDENARITLLHRSRKHEARILPQDTPVYYLREFLEAQWNLNAQKVQRERWSALCDGDQGCAKQAAEQWLNEGGR